MVRCNSGAPHRRYLTVRLGGVKFTSTLSTKERDDGIIINNSAIDK